MEGANNAARDESMEGAIDAASNGSGNNWRSDGWCKEWMWEQLKMRWMMLAIDQGWIDWAMDATRDGWGNNWRSDGWMQAMD
jgi:hypothetical protein